MRRGCGSTLVNDSLSSLKTAQEVINKNSAQHSKHQILEQDRVPGGDYLKLVKVLSANHMKMKLSEI